MLALASQEWLDRQAALAEDMPSRPGADATIQFDLSGGADGSIIFHTTLEAGRIATNALGAATEPSFTVSVSEVEYRRWLMGETDLQIGFMQGRVKVTGNIGRMLSVLPVMSGSEWRAATATLAAETQG